MKKLYLSRRNLQTLLNKLDRVADGGESACAIIKHDNPKDPFRPSMDEIKVIAVEDNVYYVNRSPGETHPLDDPASK
jgi:hypothetical protein